uniref:Uncharacterized protein n=1 Tax=Seriola lalandi dorsalis TaxID=1841481 RepID=A0A3B4WVJ5_SERLL
RDLWETFPTGRVRQGRPIVVPTAPHQITTNHPNVGLSGRKRLCSFNPVLFLLHILIFCLFIHLYTVAASSHLHYHRHLKQDCLDYAIK